MAHSHARFRKFPPRAKKLCRLHSLCGLHDRSFFELRSGLARSDRSPANPYTDRPQDPFLARSTKLPPAGDQLRRSQLAGLRGHCDSPHCTALLRRAFFDIWLRVKARTCAGSQVSGITMGAPGQRRLWPSDCGVDVPVGDGRPCHAKLPAAASNVRRMSLPELYHSPQTLIKLLALT